MLYKTSANSTLLTAILPGTTVAGTKLLLIPHKGKNDVNFIFIPANVKKYNAYLKTNVLKKC
jgi:hypothetical protein